MNTVEIRGFVDDQHRLSAEVPADIPPGPVTIVVHVPAGEDTDGNSWSQAVALRWAADWNDPREDVYTLEDGVPIDDARWSSRDCVCS